MGEELYLGQRKTQPNKVQKDGPTRTEERWRRREINKDKSDENKDKNLCSAL